MNFHFNKSRFFYSPSLPLIFFDNKTNLHCNKYDTLVRFYYRREALYHPLCLIFTVLSILTQWRACSCLSYYFQTEATKELCAYSLDCSESWIFKKYLLFIELMLHLSRVKQMYIQTIHIMHEIEIMSTNHTKMSWFKRD